MSIVVHEEYLKSVDIKVIPYIANYLHSIAENFILFTLYDVSAAQLDFL